MLRPRVCLAVLGLLAIASFFRFYDLKITPPGLFMDEAMDGVNAQQVARTGQFETFYSEDNGREGLYVNVLALAFKFRLLPETAPWSVRVPAAIAGVLTVLGMFLFASELFSTGSLSKSSERKISGDCLAGLAALFLATSSWHVNFSRIAFRAILAPCCMVWCSYFFLRMLRSRSGTGKTACAVCAGTAYGLGFYTYIAFRTTPLLFLVLIFFFHRTPGFWKSISVFVSPALVVALPIGWHYFQYPQDLFLRMSQVSATGSAHPVVTLVQNTFETAEMLVWSGDANWRHNFSRAPELYWPVGFLFVVGFCLVSGQAFFSSKRDTSKARTQMDSRFVPWFLLTWLAVGALPAIMSSEGLPHALRSLLMVVPVMVIAAAGAGALYELLAARVNRPWVFLIASCLIVLIVSGEFTRYFVDWAKNSSVPDAFNARSVAIGDQINALPPTTEKYVVVYPFVVGNYGIPLTAVPVMYVTNSFVPDPLEQKHVKHIRPHPASQTLCLDKVTCSERPFPEEGGALSRSCSGLRQDRRHHITGSKER